MTWFLGEFLPYVAVAVLVLGVAYRAVRWSRMPPSFRWTLYPYPQTASAQMGFIAGEVLTFRSLRRANRGMWLGAWLFHISMALTFVGVLVLALGGGAIPVTAGFAGLIAGGLYLAVFRLTVPRMKAVTTPVEIVNLALFLVIGIAGLAVAFSGLPLARAEAYVRGLATFRPGGTPADAPFLVLLAGIEVFLLYFAFSRMIHMVSKYFAFHRINWDRGTHS